MTNLNFQQKEIANKSMIIILLKSADEKGFPKFYFFGCKAINYKNLQDELSKNKKADLTKFGTVIEEGYGHPSDEIWDKMKKNYNLEKDKLIVFQ